MQTADIIYHFPKALELLARTADMLDDPDADVIEAYQLEGEIRDMLKKFQPIPNKEQ